MKSHETRPTEIRPDIPSIVPSELPLETTATVARPFDDTAPATSARHDTSAGQPAQETERSQRFSDGSILDGRYRIDQVLGFGGMGEVYKVHDLVADVTRALKIMSPDLACDEQSKKRFLQESDIVGDLNHPHIIRSIDINQSQQIRGLLYITFRYVRSLNLRRWMSVHYPQGKPIPVAVALEICRQVASALAEAHARGIVHRDVKPENLLVAIPAGQTIHVWLSDFGIAQLQDPQQAPRTSSQAGTLGYMAPEQVDGKSVPRSDVFALATILYELLCGQRPQGSFPAVTEVRQDIPREVNDLILCCLQPHPESRMDAANMEALFAQILQQHFPGYAVAQREPSLSVPAPVIKPSRPPAAPPTYGRGTPHTSQIAAQSTFKSLVERLSQFASCAVRGRMSFRWLWFRQAGFQGPAGVHFSSDGQALLRDSAGTVFQRTTVMGAANRSYRLHDRSVAVALPHSGEKKGRFVASFDSSKSRLKLWDQFNDPNKTQAKKVTTYSISAYDKVTFSVGQDGQFVLLQAVSSYSSGGSLRLFDRDLNQKLSLESYRLGEVDEAAGFFTAISGNAHSIYSLSDGRWLGQIPTGANLLRLHDGIAYLDSDSRQPLVHVVAWDIKKASAIRTFSAPGTSRPTTIRFLERNGRRFLSAVSESECWEWEWNTGEFGYGNKLSPSTSVRCVAYSSPLEFVIGTNGNEIVIWQKKSGTIDHVLEGHNNPVTVLALDRQGTRLVSGDASGTVIVWDLTRLEKERVAHCHAAAVTSIQFSPSGRFIFTTSSDVRGFVWRVDHWELLDILLGHNSLIESASFSPDEKLIATANGNGQLVIWDVATGAIQRQFQTNGSLRHVEFLPGGSRVLAVSDLGHWLTVWDVHSGEIVYASLMPIGDRIPLGVRIEPNSGEVLLWDPQGNVAKSRLPQWVL